MADSTDPSASRRCFSGRKRLFAGGFLPATLAVASFALTILADAYCQFVTVNWTPTPTGDAGDVEDIPQDFGIWNYEGPVHNERTGQNYTTCLPHKNSPFQPFLVDAKWRTAMSFAIIAPVFGGVATVWIFLAPCCYPAQRLWNVLSSVCILTSLFQGLTLIFLGSSVCQRTEFDTFTATGCSRIWGANSSIAAVVLWFVTGVVMRFVPPPKMPAPETQHQTVTYTETTQPDGTKVVTEQTTVVKGTVLATAEAPSETP